MERKTKHLRPKHKSHLRSFGVPSEEDFQTIKEFLKHPVAKEDLFVYSVKLCDNLLDREGEFFSIPALHQLADLFVGVGGIFNHDWQGAEQHSRIYKTEVLSDDSIEKTPVGEPYTYIVAYVYTLNTEENKPFLDKLKAGIYQEVSVGFESAKTSEVPYGERKAVRIDEIADVFEWSFVAVPAQPFAGVVKSNKQSKEEGSMSWETALAKLKSAQGIEASTVQVIENHLLRVKSLERELEDAKSKVKSLEEELVASKLDHAIDAILTELEPIDEAAAELAAGLIRDKLAIGEEEGEVIGVEEAREELKTKYHFLFKNFNSDAYAEEYEFEEEERESEEYKSKSKTKSAPQRRGGIDFSKFSNRSSKEYRGSSDADLKSFFAKKLNEVKGGKN